MSKKKSILNISEEGVKKSPFEVPENYFESFNERLQTRIQSEHEVIENQNPVRRIPVLAWVGSAAAILIGIFFIGQTILHTSNDLNFTQDEIAYILEDEIYDLDTYDLETEYALEQEEEELDYSGYNKEIIEYLIDEGIEITEIINEF